MILELYSEAGLSWITDIDHFCRGEPSYFVTSQQRPILWDRTIEPIGRVQYMRDARDESILQLTNESLHTVTYVGRSE